MLMLGIKGLIGLWQKELNSCYDLFFFYKMMAIFILVSLPAVFSGEKRTV